MMPIIRHRVGAEVNENPGCKLTLDNLRPRQSRNTKKRRNLSGIAAIRLSKLILMSP